MKKITNLLLTFILLPMLSFAQAPVNLRGFVAYNENDASVEGRMADISLAGTIDTIATLEYIPETGAALIGDTYYSVIVNDEYAEYFGMYFYYLVGYNAETFELTVFKTLDYSDYSNYPLVITKDKSGSKIFGIFYKADGKGTEFATLDVNDCKRTRIADATRQYVCLATDAKGTIYGIGGDNCLYTIDQETGAETLIGSTGVKAADDSGYYSQSMAFNTKTGTLYWAEVDASAQSSGIYEVSTETGAAKKVSTGKGLLQVFGLVVPAQKAEDDAPAQVEDMKVDFTAPSLSGTVSFTAPSKTFAGEQLSGSLTYNISSNDEVLASGQVLPGEVLKKEITVKEGKNTLSVTTSNSAGTSPEVKVSSYFGYDVPTAPDNVQLTLSLTGNLQLKWSEPKGGLNSGYIGNLTYGIVRKLPTGQLDTIQTDIKQCSYSATIEISTLQKYVYGVYAVNTTQSSATTYSNGVIRGNGVDVPVAWGSLQSGIMEDEFELFTVNDANKDNYTWYWDKSYGATYEYNSEKDANDWLFTPKANVKAGATYTIKYVALSMSSKYPERLEVKVGNSPEVSAMTTAVVRQYQVSSDVEEKSFTYTPEEDGTLCIGFHATSAANSYYLILQSVSITKDPDKAAPAAVTDLKVKAAEMGKLEATVEFTAPTKTIGGNVLTAITKIEVLREGKAIKSFENAEAGKKYTFVDVPETDATYTYSVIAYNEAGNGEEASVKTLVGEDVPGVVEATIVDEKEHVEMSWSPVSGTGANGGYVNPENVTYQIFSIDDEGNVVGYIGETADTTFTVETNTDAGSAQLLGYAMRVKGKGGTGEYGYTNTILVGAPISLPMKESFKSGGIEYFWWLSQTGSSSWWTSAGDDAVGGKGYAYYSSGLANENAWISSQKLNVRGTINPNVMFAAKIPNGATLQVEAQRRDKTSIVLATFSGTEETASQWQNYTAQISDLCKSEDFIVVRFHAYAPKAKMNFFLDEVDIRDVLDHDLAISLSAPGSAVQGTTVKATATVKNIGSADAQTYDITVEYFGGKETLSATIPLASGSTQEYSFDVPVSLFAEGDSLCVTASVASLGDEQPNNNSSSVLIGMVSPTVEPVHDLAAEISGNDVVLTWDAQKTGDLRITEGFEKYKNLTAFPLTAPVGESIPTKYNKEGWLGDWTAYDQDGGMVYGWYNSSINWPYAGYAMGFCVFDYEQLFGEAFTDAEVFVHSGKKALLCMDISPTALKTRNNDWLVSPLLSAKAQTISLWASQLHDQYGKESFEVYYSTTDKQVASFCKLAADSTETVSVWKEYTYDLPDDARYFAIRVTSKDVFGMLLDDISFDAHVEAPVKFNVFKNYEKVATTEKLTYTDAGQAKGDAFYSVSAIYADGSESAPETVAIGEYTGITSVEREVDSPTTIYNTSGVRVLRPTRDGIYIVNGKKEVIR